MSPSTPILDIIQNTLGSSGGVSASFVLGFLLLMIVVAWKIPVATQSFSFFNAGFLLAGNIVLTGMMVWLSTWAKLDRSTLGFVSMFQFFCLAAAVVFLVHSLCDRKNS